MKYSRISRAESLPVSPSKHSQSRRVSNSTSRTGNSTRLPSFNSRLRALAISVFTHSLVMQADGRVNLLVELLAGFNIVRREPAAHAFILQAFVQTVGKLLVLARIADEAGVELNRTADQGTDVGDELVGKARAAQEDFRDFALGAIDRINADGGRPIMANGLQAFGCAQIDIGKDG